MEALTFDSIVDECMSEHEFIEPKIFNVKSEKDNNSVQNDFSKTEKGEANPVILMAGFADAKGTNAQKMTPEIAAKLELKKINDDQEADEEARGDYVMRRSMIGLTLEKRSYQEVVNVVNYFMERLAYEPNYALVCLHDGPNFPHYHCLFQFPKPVTVHSKKCYFPHFEKFVHSTQGYAKYCKGEDEKHQSLNIRCEIVHEDGKIRENGGTRSAAEWKNMSIEEIREKVDCRLQQMAEKIRNEDIAREKYYQMLNEIRNKQQLKKPKVIYTTGESGSGKTYGNFQHAVNHYENQDILTLKFDKNGYAHIDGDAARAKALVIKEFRDSSMSLDEFLDMTDGYGYRLNLKGSSAFIRPERIYIASVQPVKDLYDNACSKHWEKRSQIYRRIDLYVCNTCKNDVREHFIVPKDDYKSFSADCTDYEWMKEKYNKINF